MRVSEAKLISLPVSRFCLLFSVKLHADESIHTLSYSALKTQPDDLHTLWCTEISHTYLQPSFFSDSHLVKLVVGIDCLFWSQQFPKQTGRHFLGKKKLKYPLRK